MENASKALIIAGAILLSIAIIGIGMAVYQMAASTINQAKMSGQEIDAYNAKFIKYEGIQTGSTVKTLCEVIRLHNIENEDDVSKQITLTLAAPTADAGDGSAAGSTTAEITTLKSQIKAGAKYTVSFGYTSTGMIKNIGLGSK